MNLFLHRDLMPESVSSSRALARPAGGAQPAARPPTVSVVMTVYNTVRYLPEAIDSILSQTYRDFEFIIIDDGSNDGSTDVIRDYAARDPRIRMSSRPNTGIVKAANEGLAMAGGTYIVRMDSDDISEPNRLELQVAYMEAHPECILLGSRVMLCDPYGSPVYSSGQKLTHEEIDAELLSPMGGWAVVQPSAIMRSDAVRQVGGYRGTINMSEDHDLFLRLAEKGRVANLPDVLLRYRRHYDSVAHTQYPQLAGLKEKILREAYDRRNLPMPEIDFSPWQPPPIALQLRRWGWAAIKAGNLRIARKHALGAIRCSPGSLEAWRLMYCAIRGH